MSSRMLSFILFADDTNIFCSNNNIHSLTKTVNEELKNVSDWLKANKLSLNDIQNKKQKYKATINTSLDCSGIKQVESVRFLGVHTDENINRKNHNI